MLQVEPLGSDKEFDVHCGARDNSGNVAEPPSSLQVATLDVDPPAFTAGTPRAENVRETSFEFAVQLDEPGTVRPRALG